MNPLQLALSVRSDFSIGESSFQIDKIVVRAKELGYTHVAIADYMSVSGMPAFMDKCKKAGITPIIGCTLQVVDDPTAKVKDRENRGYRLKVYVKNERGLKSLFAALSNAHKPERFYYHARMGLEDVLALEDVVVTTGDIQNLWHHPDAVAISAQLSKFREDYFIELVALNTPLFDRLNATALETAERYLQKRFVSRPAFYATPEDADATDVLKAIATNTECSSIFLPRPHNRDLCLLPPTDFVAEVKEMAARLGVVSTGTWLHGAGMVAERCTLDFTKWAPTMPKMAEDEFAALVASCMAGWKTRFARPVWGHSPDPADLQVYKDRLKFELETLKRMGFSGYFLLVEDIVNWSKENGIRVGPGRGSVGGSLIAYLMGITDIDPIRFGLLFERFINPDRLDLPDADLDFMSGKRHMVVDYITEKYGRDRVAGIVNFSTLGAASALRDTARLHGLDPWEYACSKQMESEHGVSLGLEESAARVPAIEKFKTERPLLWDHATRLEGANRTLSQHAAGVVVAGEPVVNRAVVSTRGDLPVVQWDKSRVEDFGLIKIDILGLNTLDLIDTALAYIKERHSKTIDMLELPLDDERVLTAFGAGDTTGVFQFEGGGMKKLLKDLALKEPLTFEAICAATALFRPGPLDAGLCDRYVKVRQGELSVVYDHPLLEDVLHETYGVLTYQEQIMQACRLLAKFTPGEADGVRKAMGKKDHAKMASYKTQFIDGCITHAGWTEPRASEFWDMVAGFAGYAFNKSHAAEYTLISWVTMWLKVYYPAEFFAAAMTVIDDEGKLAGLVADAQHKGLKVLPPDVNRSTDRIEIEGEDLLYAPFQAIKGISTSVAASIVQLRGAVGGKFVMTAPATTRTKKKRDGTILTEPVPAMVVGLDEATQKTVLGRTKVNTAHREKLDKVGALHSVTGEGVPPTHADRLKDRIDLMPGFTVELVKADRKLNNEHLAQIKIVRLAEEARTCEACSLKGKEHPTPVLGSSPKFMMVFDTPSHTEARVGKMLQGDTADTVKAALKDAGLKANDGYYTALVKSPKPSGQKMLTNEQINGCSEFLKQEIAILKPAVIVAMGSNAIRFFAPGIKGSPSDLAGKALYNSSIDATIVFGINPASLFFDDSKAKLLEAAIQKLAEILS
jgi:DNA polymerase-3 subunit alpha